MMARRDILYLGSPILRKRVGAAIPGSKVLGKVIRDLWDTLQYLGPNCAGLAANQIGENIDVCVIKQGSLVLINPKIYYRVGKMPSLELCYSIPGTEVIVPRYKKIGVEFQNSLAERKSIVTEDRKLSIAIQHEVDHLNGVLMIDYTEMGGMMVTECNVNNATYAAHLQQASEKSYIGRD